MVSTINTNNLSSFAAYSLSRANSALGRSMARLSSGSKIVESSEDSGGAAVFFKLNSSVLRRDALLNNLGNAMSWLQSQSASLDALGAQLSRMSELFVLMRDVTKNSEDRDNYMTEFDALRDEMVRTMSDQLNGKDLLDRSGGKDPLVVHLDESGSKTITLELSSFAPSAGGGAWTSILNPAATGTYDDIASLDQDSLDQGNGGIFFEMFQKLAGSMATNGAMQSRLGFAMDSVNTQRVAFEQAASRIGDTDVAVEVARLARSSILVESSSAMLAQANSTGRVLLKVMEG
jgi:flagellin